MSSAIDNLDEEELYKNLPQQVESDLKELEKHEVPWDQIGNILAGAPSTTVALKGGNWSAELWKSVKEEFRKFLCTDSESYSDLKTDGKDIKENSAKLLISSLSSIMGAKLGIAAGVIAPIIIWLLLVASRIGKQGLCKALNENSNRQD